MTIILSLIINGAAAFMRGLYYYFNNLRFNNWLNINEFPTPIASVFLCFKFFLFEFRDVVFEDVGFEHDSWLTLKTEGVGTSHLKMMRVRGFESSISNPYILKYHIPEHPPKSHGPPWFALVQRPVGIRGKPFSPVCSRRFPQKTSAFTPYSSTLLLRHRNKTRNLNRKQHIFTHWTVQGCLSVSCISHRDSG